MGIEGQVKVKFTLMFKKQQNVYIATKSIKNKEVDVSIKWKNNFLKYNMLFMNTQDKLLWMYSILQVSG